MWSKSFCRRFTTQVQKPKGRLLPLVPISSSPNEISIYVKGFLSRGENIDDFSRWKKAHLSKIQWEPGCFAYTWQNKNFKSHFDHMVPDSLKHIRGHLPQFGERLFPLPVMSIGAGLGHIAWWTYRGRRLLGPWGFAIAGIQDLSLIGAQVFIQYHQAQKNAQEHAKIFTKQLRKLRLQYPDTKIRVIAHSLGSKLSLKAVDEEGLIDELHLLAPAVTEKEWREVMNHHGGDFPVKKTCIYYSAHDLILEIFYLLEGEEAIGIHGLPTKLLSHKVKQYDVSEYLEGINKHKSYGWRFPFFVK